MVFGGGIDFGMYDSIGDIDDDSVAFGALHLWSETVCLIA